MTAHLYLIDGYGFVFRAYHSLPPLTNPEGTPVGAVYGFTNMLLRLRQKIEAEIKTKGEAAGPQYLAVVFDSGRKSFRNDLYEQYKANRPPPPDDLVPQFALVREAAEALHLPVLELINYEADDLIATYTKLACEQGAKVTIVSSDKDLMQLVSTHVDMFDAMKNRTIGIPEVKEKFGVPPASVLDVLALMGDSSDNIPGVPSIGPKTASELINQFHSLEGVLSNLSQIKQEKRRQVLSDNAEAARLSYKLASLDYNTPLPLPLEALAVREMETETLARFVTRHGFKSLSARMHIPAPVQQETPVAKELVMLPQITISDMPALQKLELSNEPRLGLLLENESIQLFTERTEYKIAFGIGAVQGDLLGGTSQGLTLPQTLGQLKPYLESAAILKVCHDAKKLMRICLKLGISVKAVDDIMLLSYVLDGSSVEHSLAALGHLMAAHTRLKQRLFTEKMVSVYETLERPLMAVLAEMEEAGIKLDEIALRSLSQDFTRRLNELEREIHTLSGAEFNVGSPKQLGEILFEKMGIPGGKKLKKSGTYATDVSVLEELSAQGHVIAEKILEWRMIAKLKNTYTEALSNLLDANARVHTTYAMTVANTGRLSSQNPNLQNIPIRSEEGRKIRHTFVAPEGFQLISADYSQIELRLLAAMAEIEPLKAAFAKDLDIHTQTASQVFGVPLDQVTASMRRSAKTINFGIIYGQSAFGLAQQLKIPRSEAGKYIDAYFQQYPGIKDYMERTKNEARQQGYVKTLWGRKCYIPGIADRNPARRQMADRAAINAPLQGTAADIIKKAMITLDLSIKAIPSLRMLLQIHDELVFEVKTEEADKACALIQRTMQQAALLSVPLKVDVSAGQNWGEIH